MAPDNQAPARALYDNESDQPRARRRAAADWGVNEDIFDRMPSRFARAQRRPQSQEIVLVRDAADTSVAAVVQYDGEAEWREATATARAEAPVRTRGDVRIGEVRVSARTERASTARVAGELDPRAQARAMMSWGEDLDDDVAPMVPGEARTIVLSRDDEPAYEAITDAEARRQTAEFASLEPDTQERRTVKISGHPDRLPVPRTQRAPRTAVERVAHRPDRIAGYAVALGFLLVLIAVLTTG